MILSNFVLWLYKFDLLFLKRIYKVLTLSLHHSSTQNETVLRLWGVYQYKQAYINTSKGGSVRSHSLISISCCLNVVVSSCKLHSLLHSDRTIWRMWNYHRSRDSMASTLVFEGWGASTLVIKVLWWSSIIVEMLNRRFFVVRIDIIWKRGLIMHKLCTLCNLCKLLHSYVIYAFYVTDCIIMQIMNIPCIVVKIKLIITAM